jgi:aromatic ring-opening dioxygenase catalytic subunit (LigB family)
MLIGTTPPAPVLYIPHGGGPLPLLGDPAHAQLVDFLQNIPNFLGTPSAIVLISAHWEEVQPSITGGLHPELIYDYYGFPPESYRIQYPAPGDPDLATRLHTLLANGGLQSRLDDRRGFDHGLFVPLKIMYPQADIPCVQLSLLASLDPKAHIALGKALAPLRQEDVLIIGSGFSFHNLRAFFTSAPGTPDHQNEAFNQWLIDTCTDDVLTSDEREERLASWTTAPHARYCHPREEHLLPLHVCLGLAQAKARLVFDGEVLGKRACAFLW